ncbi:MAG: malate dehydrogenase (quinone) [Chitinophagaceae bacterium]|nr:MAG: malate dehydrogenase (quinone) [Chitinophagaceae bacterium]
MADSSTEVILIGAGIMSATLGTMIKELYPAMKITILERLDLAASESSDAWNNAGTGHSAFCEMNYTPVNNDGSINTSKAIKVAEAFEVSRQFWSYLVKKDILPAPGDFIRSIPHMCFVTGKDGAEYLRKRYQAMKPIPLFEEMEFSENPAEIRNWIPLMMDGRNETEPVAATRMNAGTDVNFGSLTRTMFSRLQQMEGVEMCFNHEVKTIQRDDSGGWNIKVKDLTTRKKRKIHSRFVFIGAGGGSLTLLLKSGIPEGKSFGGFPVSGQWLRCNNKQLIEKHDAKVYGRASVGTPPMSVPHLDTRIINGERAMLFGPYAGFTTKFLKKGSLWDLFLSLRWSNIIPMISAGLANIPLTRYLVQQVTQSSEERMAALRQFVPQADAKDWELEIAGQRVQVIKKDEEHGGILEFGTEVVSSADGTLAALLGASPGASTAVSIMIDLLNTCFPDRMQSAEWQQKFKEMIPSYGEKLALNAEACRATRAETARTLQLTID